MRSFLCFLFAWIWNLTHQRSSKLYLISSIRVFVSSIELTSTANKAAHTDTSEVSVEAQTECGGGIRPLFAFESMNYWSEQAAVKWSAVLQLCSDRKEAKPEEHRRKQLWRYAWQFRCWEEWKWAGKKLCDRPDILSANQSANQWLACLSAHRPVCAFVWLTSSVCCYVTV